MARFSEEEVETLQKLVELELWDAETCPFTEISQIYVPHLRTLIEKLGNYYNKHYPEDKDDA